MAELTKNQNYLQPTGFSVIIGRENYPNLEFFAQSVSHPSIDIAAAPQAARRLVSIPTAGDAVTFGDLDITFLIDEDMNSYLEMFNWMIRILNENQTTAAAALESNAETNVPTEADITINILTSHNNPNKTIKYHNCVPISLSGIEFSSQSTPGEPLTFSGGFAYKAFEIE